MKMTPGTKAGAVEDRTIESTAIPQGGTTANAKSISEKKDESEILKSLLIESHLRSMYDFRYNEVTCKFEYSNLGAHSWRPINKIIFNSIRRDLNNTDKSLRCSRDQLECIIESDFSPSVNPIKEYFLSLPSVTGTENIDRLLETVHVGCRDRWRTCVTKWLVAVTANALDDSECCNHTCLVLVGSQGIGKTRWLNGLCPKSLGKGYLFLGKFNPDNKDALRHVAERLLINIDDQLQTLNWVDEDKIKAIITQSKVSYRKPYDINVEDYPHRASFMASVNSPNYLTDSTGSRRFISFKVECISLAEQRAVDMDLVYAECVSLLNSGFHYWFEGDEIVELDNQNREFMFNSHEYDLLTQFFRIPRPDEEIVCQPLTATQIHHHMESRTSDRLNFVKVSKALKRMVRECGLKNKSFRMDGSVYHGYLLMPNGSFDISKVES